MLYSNGVENSNFETYIINLPSQQSKYIFFDPFLMVSCAHSEERRFMITIV